MEKLSDRLFAVLFVGSILAVMFGLVWYIGDDEPRGPSDGYLDGSDHVTRRTGFIEVIVNADGFENVVTFCNDGHRVFVQQGTGIAVVEDGCEIGEE